MTILVRRIREFMTEKAYCAAGVQSDLRHYIPPTGVRQIQIDIPLIASATSQTLTYVIGEEASVGMSAASAFGLRSIHARSSQGLPSLSVAEIVRVAEQAIQDNSMASKWWRMLNRIQRSVKRLHHG